MTARLLVVDDDELVRVLMEEILGQRGYAVETVEDGQAAWQAIDLDPARYDLMLLDKQMPRLDGISLLRRIRADNRFAGDHAHRRHQSGRCKPGPGRRRQLLPDQAADR
jgi:CheY-like chemotaxis protein